MVVIITPLPIFVPSGIYISTSYTEMPRQKKVVPPPANVLRIDDLLFGRTSVDTEPKQAVATPVSKSVEVKPEITVVSESTPLCETDYTVVPTGAPTIKIEEIAQPVPPLGPNPVQLLRQTFRNYFGTLEEDASLEDHLNELQSEFRFLNARCVEAHYLQKEVESLKHQNDETEHKAEEVLEILQCTEERLHKFERLTDMLADEYGPRLIQSFWRSINNE